MALQSTHYNFRLASRRANIHTAAMLAVLLPGKLATLYGLHRRTERT